MGFSLFGSSGDKTTNQSTTNVTNDTTTTTANSNNLTTNTANTLNSMLTNNQSYIRNDSKVQNTALQLTDAFNRISTNNLANVGNTTIGAAPSVMDYAALFKAFPQSPVTQTDTSKLAPLLDFNALSQLPTDQLNALNNISKGVQSGFVDNNRIAGQTFTDLVGTSPGSTGANKTVLYIVLAAAAVLIVFILKKR